MVGFVLIMETGSEYATVYLALSELEDKFLNEIKKSRDKSHRKEYTEKLIIVRKLIGELLSDKYSNQKKLKRLMLMEKPK